MRVPGLRRGGWVGVVAVSTLAVSLGCSRADSGVRQDVVVNSSVGGTEFVQAAAVAAIIEKHTPWRGFAEPTRSHVAAMPLFRDRQLDLIFVSQSEMYLANRGEEYYESVGPTPMRIVAAGAELMFSFFTTPDSGIERIEDLAGRKVMWETEASGVFYWAAKLVLDRYGIREDVISIPSPAPPDRAEALKAGWVDAYACSTQFQAMEIIHGSVGLRMLDIPREAADWVNARYPALYPAICPRGYNGGMVTRDVPVLAASTALQARADLEDEVVYAVLEAIYDNFDEFSASHVSLEDMTLDRAVSLRSINPYHTGAIQFFKDRGVWSDEAEAMQGRLLAELGVAR